VRPDSRLAPFNASDDERLARLLILLRRRVGMTQRALAVAAGVPRRDIILVEDGLVGLVLLERVRQIFAVVGGRARLVVWWNGASADRLLDARHAALVERAVDIFQRRGWEAAVEVSFSRYGERGSIDILAGHQPRRAIAVSEVKSDIGSFEEMNRVLDVKERLAPAIAEARFGWRPATVGRLLIVPDVRAVRRTIEQHARTMQSIYPARGREVRAWLRTPAGPLRGIWFLSEVPEPNPESPNRGQVVSEVAVGNR
jgi:DNA-binding XRE family transcriptional regulator